MPIKEAERISGGAFCNVKALAGERPGDNAGALMLFRIVDWESEEYPPLNEDYGWTMPFVYDAVAIYTELDEDGELVETGRYMWLRQDMRFGQNPMWVLRGHPRPKADVKRRDLPQPENEVGDEIIGRLALKQGSKKDSKPYPVLNKPSAAEKKLALKVRDELGGDDWGHDGDDPF